VAVWQCGSVAVWQCGSVAVWQCGSVAVWQCDSAAVRQCGSAAVRQRGSAAVRQRAHDVRCGGERRQWHYNGGGDAKLTRVVSASGHVVLLIRVD
jgi:hypothetical protein